MYRCTYILILLNLSLSRSLISGLISGMVSDWSLEVAGLDNGTNATGTAWRQDEAAVSQAFQYAGRTE